MLNLLFLLSAASAPIALALPTVQLIARSSPLRISHISADGPTCNSGNSSPPLTQSNANRGATGVIGFDAEIAYAKPEGSNKPYSDCTLTVDFEYPVGLQLNYVDVLARGELNLSEGMNQVVRLDVWFPSQDAVTATNRTRASGKQDVSRSFDIQAIYNIPKSRDFWDACFGQSQFKIRIQQDASSTSRGNGRNLAFTQIESVNINLDEGSNGGRYTSFCGAGNMPKQSGGRFGSGGASSGLGLLGSTFKTGP
ncbi:hypothetical protein EJ08DRAFT_730272 [Tothia fuscella]|uniref:Uncharacterized protein n=1 Tax=Tothia fuscella TaxID=1048955 RepID=A0A9P4P0S0_9PEZI|nr:hypothetical protein EJ08DRAFT_730272 [Tothia fuscella]